MFVICSAMPDLPTAYPLRDLFDAAVRHRQVRLTCRRCGHQAVFDGAALWWLFERKGWKARFGEAVKRFWCRRCSARAGTKVRDGRLELVEAAVTETGLPMPSAVDWKREMRRRR